MLIISKPVAAPEPLDVADFQAVCAAGGQSASCCVLPLVSFFLFLKLVEVRVEDVGVLTYLVGISWVMLWSAPVPELIEMVSLDLDILEDRCSEAVEKI